MHNSHSESRANPVRIGLIGGGPASFGGTVHPMAIRLDGRLQIVAGVFSRDPAQAGSRAEIHNVSPDRGYPTAAAMFAAERKRADGIEAVAIVTPRESHFELASAAIEAGLHVICEKPITETFAQARDLQRLAEQAGVIFCLTHGYSGYPMIRQAREMISAGAIGDVRMLNGEFLLGMGAARDESMAQRAPWAFDLAGTPHSWILLEIGSHVEHLARYVTGLAPVEVSAEIGAASPLVPFDDTAFVTLRYENGARGSMWFSASAAGAGLNSLKLRVHGSTGGLEWHQASPEDLIFTQVDQPRQTLQRGEAGQSDLAVAAGRLVPGLPEGFLEAFANLYRDFAAAIRAQQAGTAIPPSFSTFPGISDGLKVLQFAEAAHRSALNGSAWTRV